MIDLPTEWTRRCEQAAPTKSSGMPSGLPREPLFGVLF
jgi:hypothetical protein